MTKLLVVDDAATMRAFVRNVLGDIYTYVEACDGSEGLKAADAESPDIILLDVNMPVLDGIETLRTLKANPDTAGIPVVMATTRGEDQAFEICHSLGCAAFLTKPLDPEELAATLAGLVGADASGGERGQIPATVYAFITSVHNSHSLYDVIDVVQETLLNLVGTEDFVIYLRDAVTERYESLTTMGSQENAVEGIELGVGAVGSALGRREVTYGEPLAVVPLLQSGAAIPVGAIVVATLLHGRTTFLPRDKAVLELMSVHAGLAIEACLMAAAGRKPQFTIRQMRALLQDDSQAALERIDQQERAAKMRAARLVDSLVVRACDRTIGLPATSIAEVFRMVATVAQLPGAPVDSLGVVDCRGQLIPLFDLGVRLGLCERREEEELVDGHVVVLDTPTGPLGLAVDGLVGLYQDEAEIIGGLEASDHLGALVLGAVRLPGGALAPLIDELQIFSSDDHDELRAALDAATADGAIPAMDAGPSPESES